jgi:hypothetical protein
MPSISLLPPNYNIQHPIRPAYNQNIVVGERSNGTFSRGQMSASVAVARIVDVSVKVINDVNSIKEFFEANHGQMITITSDTDIFKVGALSVDCYLLSCDVQRVTSKEQLLLIRLRYAYT